ncbi:MAG: 50S ribosomal protein L15 [Defluviitaleaceae bacterium]|nr:50S ribosomal protein L15 [Defluviitaleaceae bacterium]
MQLGQLAPAAGSKKKRFRVGRGHGSGAGKTSGRGHGGQKSRSGGSIRQAFEGGQFPMYRRLPKRGFKNRNHLEIVAINVSLLDAAFNSGDIVDIAALQSKGLISKPRDGVKILGNGEITKALTVCVHRFSESAKAKIEAVGGKAEVI